MHRPRETTLSDIETLLRFSRKLRIVHHIPGRIRLKLDASVSDEQVDAIANARQFGKSLDSAPGIRSVSLNLLARSCTVEYDTRHIPSAAWSDLVNGVRSPAAEALLGVLVTDDREPGGA